ncbi:MAG: hypothetical protein ACNYPE_04040 [Candidatus Azotimanducaceae bacterium WSBS_2022_MAG_OTU7]
MGIPNIESLTGELEVIGGTVLPGDFTLLLWSVAEEVQYFDGDSPYSGSLQIVDDKLQNPVNGSRKSLIHSVDLTSEAFTRERVWRLWEIYSLHWSGAVRIHDGSRMVILR